MKVVCDRITMAVNNTLEPIYQGEDIDLVVTIKDPKTNLPLDLSGASVKFVIYSQGGNGSQITSKVTPTEIEIANQSEQRGVCIIHLLDTDTATVAPGLYYHETSVSISGRRRVVEKGTVPISLSVSQ